VIGRAKGLLSSGRVILTTAFFDQTM